MFNFGLIGKKQGLPFADLFLYSKGVVGGSYYLVEIVNEYNLPINSGESGPLYKMAFSFPDNATMRTLDTNLGGDVLFDSTDSMAPFVRTWQEWMDLAVMNVGYLFMGEAGIAAYTSDQTANADKIKRAIRAYGDTPAQFTFTDYSDVELSTSTESAAITITNIGLTTDISIVSGEYEINDSGTWTSAAGTVTVYDTVKVRATSSGSYETGVAVTLTVGGVSDTFTITTREAVTTPDAFSFTDQTDIEPSTLTESDAITVTGIEADAAISITGGEYEINDSGTWLTEAGTVSLNDTVKVRQTSSSGYETETTATLTIDSVSDDFSLITRAIDTTPAAFSFTDATNVELSTLTESDAITASDFDGSLSFTVTGGEAEKNGSGVWASSGTVVDGDTVIVRDTSSSEYETTVGVTLNINGVSDTFTITTKSEAETDMILSIKTDNTGTTGSTEIGLPLAGTFDIDWGDGNSETITNAVVGTLTEHDYGVGNAGTYTVRIGSGCTQIKFNATGDYLKLLAVTNLGTTGLTTLEYAFYGCYNMTSFVAGNSDTSLVTSLYYFLRYCTGATEIDLSGMDTSGVTTARQSMDHCYLVTEIDISGLDWSACTTMRGMFYGNSAMTSLGDVSDIDLSGLNGADASVMQDFAYGCALTESEVDAVLYACTQSGKTGISLDLDGGTMAPPSATGDGYVTTLTGDSWVVSVNS